MKKALILLVIMLFSLPALAEKVILTPEIIRQADAGDTEALLKVCQFYAENNGTSKAIECYKNAESKGAIEAGKQLQQIKYEMDNAPLNYKFEDVTVAALTKDKKTLNMTISIEYKDFESADKVSKVGIDTMINAYKAIITQKTVSDLDRPHRPALKKELEAKTAEYTGKPTELFFTVFEIK